VRFLRSILGFNSDQKEIEDLRSLLAENDKKIEKLIEMFNMLATFDEQMANDIRHVASHVALIEISMSDRRKSRPDFLKKKSNDDDLIN
jgi:hypothetical protein